MELTIAEEKFIVEDKLYEKVKFMSERVIKKHPTQDACLTNSGYEGEGKTNASIVEAIIVHLITGRKINLFFTTESARIFAQHTDSQLIIIDEPSLDALASDANTTNVKNLLRLTSTMRKKRHFLIVNFAKFWKFPEFLVVDRALGMIHLYSRHGTDPGRFLYIRKKNLEPLWNAYKKQGKREYAKLKNFGGRFPYIMDRLFDKLDIRVENVEHATLKDYERLKDKAIEGIGAKKSKKEEKLEQDLRALKLKVVNGYERFGISQVQLAKWLGVTPRTLQQWANLSLNQPKSLGKAGFNGDDEAQFITSMAQDDDYDDPELEAEGLSYKREPGQPDNQLIVEDEPSEQPNNDIDEDEEGL